MPAQSFSAPARACVIAAARFMPGVCARVDVELVAVHDAHAVKFPSGGSVHRRIVSCSSSRRVMDHRKSVEKPYSHLRWPANSDSKLLNLRVMSVVPGFAPICSILRKWARLPQSWQKGSRPLRLGCIRVSLSSRFEREQGCARSDVRLHDRVSACVLTLPAMPSRSFTATSGNKVGAAGNRGRNLSATCSDIDLKSFRNRCRSLLHSTPRTSRLWKKYQTNQQVTITARFMLWNDR